MLTPQDIENKMFKVSFKGYDTDEVDDFLQEICDSYVEVYIEGKKFKEQNGLLSEAVGQYKSMEDTLNNALSVADKSTEEIEEEAHKRAAVIIKNAEYTAEAIIAEAKQKAELEQQKFDEIKTKMEAYKEKITDLLNTQMSILNGVSALKSDSTESIDTNPIKKAKAVHEMKTETLPVVEK